MIENMNHPVVIAARAFATGAHGAVGQKRKYTGEDYIVHPTEVAEIVAQYMGTPEQIAAAFLHDVVEDTQVTHAKIKATFGEVVARYVFYLTDISTKEDGNRRVRKAIDRAHIANAPPEAKMVKLADLISNTKSIVQYDPGFARVYLEEKRALLEVLAEGSEALHARALRILEESIEALKERENGK